MTSDDVIDDVCRGLRRRVDVTFEYRIIVRYIRVMAEHLPAATRR